MSTISPGWTLQIPPDYDLQTMIADLGQWLSSEHGMETDARPVGDAVIIEARAGGWKVTRMLKRRAEALFIVLRQDDGLHVAFATEDPGADIGDESAGRSGGILGLASRAVGSTVDLAGDVADGLADALTEKKTPAAILAFIHDYIANRFIAAGCPADLETDPKRSPFTDAPSAMEANWIQSRLQPGEIMLAWMETSTRPPSATVDWRFLLTSHQAALAAVSDRGLEAAETLPPAEMAVTDVIGRDTVAVGDATFRTRHANDGLFREIAPLVPLGPEGRIAGTARLVFAHRKGGDDRGPHALSLLDRLCGISDDPLHRLARLYVDSALKANKAARGAFDGGRLPPDFADMTAALPERTSPARLRDWADAWSMPAWDRLTLGGSIADAHPDSVPHAEVVGPLLTDARDRLMTESKDPAVHTLADITAARNLKRRGPRPEAARILEDRLSSLPDESLSDLLPAREADLTRGEGGQLIRVTILELLADLRGDPDRPDPATLAELASLQPLVDARLRDLAAIAGPDLKKQAESVLSILATGGLEPAPSGPETVPTGKTVPLKKKDIENRLRHPSAREGTVFNKIQSMLASRNAPDHTALKFYARRVTPEKHPNLSAALADGAWLLGMGAVEGYVAFGDLNTGVRGYEGKPPFLLVGGDHLEADSPFFLTPAERRFLIGAELAHIRFGHERVTSREVWEGVFGKAMTAVEMFPVFGTYLGKIGHLGKFAGRAADAAKKASGIHDYLSKARSAASTASNLYGRFGGGGTDDSVGEDEGNLIGAFRAMQLTADRAALVLCGDLRAAVRAMFLSSRRLQPELDAARRCGLRAFLSRTDDSGEPMFQDLAIRIAALISFYLSEEYRGLRGEGFPEISP